MQEQDPKLSFYSKLGSKVDLKKNALLIVCLLGLALFLVHIYLAFLQPNYSFVDDNTYVSAAVRMLLGRQCSPIAENACNYEHPPLAKILLALGFAIFGRTQVVGALVGVGINQLGGRFFQILMNFLAAPILYLIVNKISGNWKMAFIASVILVLDPLYFTLSLTTELDNAMLFFGLAALLPLAYITDIGREKGLLVSGIFVGLSILSKENGVFILLAVLSYVLFVGMEKWKRKVWSCFLICIAAAGVFILGIQLFDSLFTTFPSFISQLHLIIHFQAEFGSQQLQPLTGPVCNLYNGLCPTDRSLVPHITYSGIPALPVFATQCSPCWTSTNPLDWLTYFPPVIVPTDLVLAPNYVLVWLCFVWVPVATRSFKSLRMSREGRILLMALFIFVWNMVSNLWIFAGLGRAVFEWYFLPAVPALAIGAAYLVTRPHTPKWLAYFTIAALVVVALLLSPLTFHQIFPQPQVCNNC